MTGTERCRESGKERNSRWRLGLASPEGEWWLLTTSPCLPALPACSTGCLWAVQRFLEQASRPHRRAGPA